MLCTATGKQEEIMGNDDRIQNTTDTTTETTEAIKSDKMIETRDDRQGHRMLTYEYVVDLCGFSSTGSFIWSFSCQIRPERDMNADMDGEKSIHNVIENEAVRLMWRHGCAKVSRKCER